MSSVVCSVVCLQCRVALPPGGRCEDPAHVSITLPQQRAALVAHVWGDLNHQVEALRRVYRARVGTLQSTAIGIGAGLGLGLAAGLGSLATLAVATGASMALSRLTEHRARSSAPVHPRGAEPVPPALPFARGRIRAAPGTVSPASRGECAAWALELRYEAAFGSRVMLRAAATGGLDIELESGARARIAAGPIRTLHGLPQLPDYSVAELEAYLRSVDPGRSIMGELCPAIPFNVIGEDLLQVGDRVELYQSFEPAVFGGGAALYREAPATILVPRGVPTLRRL